MHWAEAVAGLRALQGARPACAEGEAASGGSANQGVTRARTVSRRHRREAAHGCGAKACMQSRETVLTESHSGISRENLGCSMCLLRLRMRASGIRPSLGFDGICLRWEARHRCLVRLQALSSLR